MNNKFTYIIPFKYTDDRALTLEKVFNTTYKEYNN